jgi:hypothetical protein
MPMVRFPVYCPRVRERWKRPTSNPLPTPNSQLRRLGVFHLWNGSFGNWEFWELESWELGIGSGWALGIGRWELSWELVDELMPARFLVIFEDPAL